MYVVCFNLSSSMNFYTENTRNEASPTFGHANANFSVFIERVCKE